MSSNASDIDASIIKVQARPSTPSPRPSQAPANAPPLPPIQLRNRVSSTTDIAEKQKSLQVSIASIPFQPDPLTLHLLNALPPSLRRLSQDLLSIAPKAKKAVAEHFFAVGFSLLQGVDRSDEDTVETVCRWGHML
jgi:hypothetical protein